MKKSWIITLIIAIVVIGIIVGILMYSKNNNRISEENIINNTVQEISEKVTDECTEEWEEMEEEAKTGIEANSSDEKISPNALIILNKYYIGCEHTVNEYIDVPSELVNKNQSDLIKTYPGWEIKQYSSTEIVLFKQFEGECGQHFILRNDNGKITIYRVNENNEEEVYEKTEISVEYLTDTDKIEIENGIRVYGKEKLNQIIEDFE